MVSGANLIRIGYGDFEPLSNSGKPFFVFWSLLAVPTLTILISNMGDTVVKWVKDATIWLGEITVLPSDESSVLDRLRYGIYKMTFGDKAAERKRQRKEDPDASSEDLPHLEEPPGRILGRFRSHRHHPKPGRTEERLAKDFEKCEAEDEHQAHLRGDTLAEDEHHYRRLLLSEIRKIYADTTASQSKQYTYAEWAYYIKLLGQDESDSRYHKKAKADEDAPGSHPDNEHEHHHHHHHDHDDSSGTADPSKPEYLRPGDPSSIKWSWIGQRSPLMGDKEESAWLLVSRSLARDMLGDICANS
jgi:potassium channel subfamily K, other eukaryote